MILQGVRQFAQTTLMYFLGGFRYDAEVLSGQAGGVFCHKRNHIPSCPKGWLWGTLRLKLV